LFTIFIDLYISHSAFSIVVCVLTEIDQWFITEILPHEGVLVRYLNRVWRNSSEVSDLRQDIYVRIYESARTHRPAAPKAFLFTTARNLMTDRLRHSRVVPIDSRSDFDGVDALIDEISPERQVSSRQELSHLAHALDSLSDKCRSVIWLRRVEGLSQRETAQQLGLQEGAVESQLARGLLALTVAVFGQSIVTVVQPARKRAQHEPD
jgi:RNA polymerase sigma factor (sigma-70 family)